MSETVLPFIPPPPAKLKISPSAIATYRECARKWAWRAVAHVVVPQHKSAQLGTETHSQLEAYLSGKDFDFTKTSGYIAASAMPFLPPPNSPGMELERHFKFLSDQGHIYHGYIDVLAADSSIFPGIAGGRVSIPAVADHKTTSNLAYAKKPADLHKDPQAIIYAMAVFDRFPEAEQCDLIWTYILTRGAKKAQRTHLRVAKCSVTKNFHEVELTANELIAIHSSTLQPLDLPPTLSACSAYGGCPHHPSKGGGCTDLSILNPQGKTMTATTEDMLNGLQSRLGTNGTTGSADALPAWMTSPVDPGPGKSDAPSLSSMIFDKVAPVITNQINPPGEALPESAALLPRPVPRTEGPLTRRPRRTKAQMAADAKAEVLAKNPLAELTAETEKLGGYAREFDNTPPTIPAPAPAGHAHLPFLPPPSVVPSFPAVPVTIPPPAIVALPGESFGTLYVDCYPVGAEYYPAEKLFAAVQRSILNETGTADYRLIDYKGAGVFAAAINELVEQGPFGGTDIVLDSRTPEGALTVAGLTARARKVVRGLR